MASNQTNIPETTRPLRVFLCHSSGDKPAVRKLYRRLRDDNIQSWLDEEDLLPGQDWAVEIPKAVRAADIVLVCLSQGSTTKTGYVQKEIKHALDVADEQPEENIFIIPVKLEECEVPNRLSRWQWVNLFEERGYERLMLALNARANEIAAQTEYSLGKSPKADIKHPIDWGDLRLIFCESFDAADANVDNLETLKTKFNDIWLPYKEEIWSATITEGVYKLTNVTNSSAVQYQYLSVNKMDMGEFPLSAEVMARSTKSTLISGVGLVYRYRRESKDYYAFVLSKDDGFTFYRRQAGEFIPLYSGRSNVIHLDKFNKLAIIGKQSTFSLYINDNFVKTIRDSALVGGDVGIIAMGIGEFLFDNFTVYEVI